MPKHNLNSFRLQRARELGTLADILNRNEMCANISPLRGAENECREGTGDTWGYKLERLIFRLRDIKHPIPKNVFNVSLELNVKVSGICIQDNEICDPFRTLEFDMVLNGEYNSSGQTKKVMCAWHLDREDAGTGVHEFIHPSYHFQHGGRNVWRTGFSFGAALILESPRLAHPPMDVILGVDFVLTNFFVSSALSFRAEGDYQNILRSAHARVWRPYVQALAHAWTHMPSKSDWKYTEPWPQLF